jgi:antitoxin ParD1/3/4
MATMNISLPDEMKEWVEAQVAEGRFSNSSDFVRSVLRDAMNRAEYDAWMKEQISVGVASGFQENKAEDLFNEAQRNAERAYLQRAVDEGLKGPFEPFDHAKLLAEILKSTSS